MSHPAAARAAAVLLPALLLAASAQAQPTYRCQQGGRTVISDRPCGPSTGMGAYGPVSPPAAHPRGYASSSTQSPARADSHLSYLSPRCAELNEAMRTGRSRGVSHQTLSDLRETYRRECQEDDSEARRDLHRREQLERDQRRAQREGDQRAQAERERASAQCGELKRILVKKQERWNSLNEGERADVERSKAAYQQRCGAG